MKNCNQNCAQGATDPTIETPFTALKNLFDENYTAHARMKSQWLGYLPGIMKDTVTRGPFHTVYSVFGFVFIIKRNISKEQYDNFVDSLHGGAAKIIHSLVIQKYSEVAGERFPTKAEALAVATLVAGSEGYIKRMEEEAKAPLNPIQFNNGHKRRNLIRVDVGNGKPPSMKRNNDGFDIVFTPDSSKKKTKKKTEVKTKAKVKKKKR